MLNLLHDSDPRIGDALDLLGRLSLEGVASVTLNPDGLRVSGPDLHVRMPSLDWATGRDGWWQAITREGPLMVAWVSWETDYDEDGAA